MENVPSRINHQIGQQQQIINEITAQPDEPVTVNKESILVRSHLPSGFSDSQKLVHSKDLISHGSVIRAVEFSDDGSLLVSSGFGDLVLIWNLDLGIEAAITNPTSVLRITSDTISDPPFSLAISPDNNRIFVGGDYPHIYIYDSHTQVLNFQLNPISFVLSIFFI